MGGKGGQTVGYHYLFSILFGLGRGPVNELVEIKVGDKTAWGGHLCSPNPQAINAPNLFGGRDKEGGIQGPFRLQMGAADQVLPGPEQVNVGAFAGTAFSKVSGGPMGGTQTLPGVKESIGGRVSDMRGWLTLWFDGLISSMNPYPKDWAFRVRRYSAGWHNDDPWYPIKSVIFLAGGKIHAMNGAHIVYECLTNPVWGRGLDRSKLNENSFIYAANTLCDEAFGLCIPWRRQEDIDPFIQRVLDHIGGVLYEDPETGQETLRLIRGDYNPDDLPVFTPSTGLVSIEEDDSSSQDTAFNEIIGTGHDPITNEDFQVRVHNLAARHSAGAPNADQKDYKGIPTKDLLLRKLQGDLRVHVAGLKKLVLTLDRRGWKIRPGMPFRIQDPRRGIADMIVRAGEIEDRSFRDGRVKVKVMEDVYGLPDTSFVTPVESSWQPPATEAAPAAAERLIEAGYRDIFLRFGDTVADGLDPTDAYIGQLAAAPNTTTYNFDLASRAQGEPEYQLGGTGSFTGTALLAADIGPLDTVFTVSDAMSLDESNIGQAILVDDEMMALVDYDPATLTATVARGVADTLPAAHLTGARIWTSDDDLISDQRSYSEGETVETLVLTRTASDVLTPAEATVNTVTLIARQTRPYPPGNFQVDGEMALALDSSEHPEPVLTWAHRDRITQEDALVAHGDASVGPEAGTTYNIRLYNKDTPDVLLREVLGVADATWTYDAATQALDGDPVAVYIELESERDGIASWQKYRVLVWLKSGYGYGYGYNYGGA